LKIHTVESMDRGLAYGEACFETFRVINGHIFDWPGHWRRLTLGLSEFGILLTPGLDEEVLFASLRQAAGIGEDALVRLTISGGQAAWGLIRRAEPVAYIQAMAYQHTSSPMFLRLATWPFALQRKSAKFVSDYADTLRALSGAADTQVLFQQNGFLLATATANILLYRNGAWHTPPDIAGVLPGRVRACLIRHELVRESACPVGWLEDCEAVAVCNSGLFLRAVAWIDGVERNAAMDAKPASLLVLLAALKKEEGVAMEIKAW